MTDTVPTARTHEFDAPGSVRLSVTAGAGVVRVDAVDGGRTVVELRPARDGDDAAADLVARSTVEQRGGQVVVDVPRPGAGFLRRSPGLAITVSVPIGSALEVQADSADVRASGRLESVRSKTGSGDVALADVGEVNAQSGSGDVELEHAGGSVRVQSGSGDLVLRRVDGACTASTGSGDVRVGRAGGPVQVKSGSGDVSVDDAHGDVAVDTASGDQHVARVRAGQLRANSASGDVHVGVADGTAVWLDVSSLTGSVRSSLEGGDPPADGEDSVELRVVTVSGDVWLSRS